MYFEKWCVCWCANEDISHIIQYFFNLVIPQVANTTGEAHIICHIYTCSRGQKEFIINYVVLSF